MSFKDFLSKQPMKVIVNTEITDIKVKLPIEVDSKSFYNQFSNEIESSDFTTEKAIFIASKEKTSSMIYSRSLLNSKIHF